MARIVHRHRLPSLAPAPGLRRLPVTGRVFLILAAIVGAVEIWPAINAAWLGVTDVVGELADVLPTAFRNAAIVALPAAVLWARPRAPRVNPWLWKGALIVALVQLARYPAGLLQDALLENVTDATSLEYTLVTVLSLLLAFATTLGIWALSEGLKDAGARLGRMVIALLALGVAAVMVVVFGGSVMLAIQGGVDPQLVVNLVSVVANGLFLFALALLAARAVAGTITGCDPRKAWLLGAVSAVSLAVLPVVSIGVTLAGSMSGTSTPEVVFVLLRVAVFIGWPLFAVALGLGMGAQPRRIEGFRARRFRLTNPPRVTRLAAPATDGPSPG